MQNLKKLSLIAAVAAVSLSASWSLAATAVWDGGTAGNGTDWGTAANWRPDVAPVAGDSVQFNATNSTTGNTVVTNGSTSVTGINGTGAFQVGQTVTGTGIQAGTTIVSIDSNSAITLSLPATVSGTPQLTIANTGGLASSPTLALGASQTINTLNQYSQAANFGIGTAGDISSGYTLTLTNSSRTNFTGSTLTIASNVVLAPNVTGKSTWTSDSGSNNGSIIITGSVGSSSDVILNKGGAAGTVTMNGANTFTGSVVIDAGTLSLGGSNAYTGTTTASGGTLAVNFSTSTATNTINSASGLILGGVRGGGTVTVTGKNVASSVNSQAFNGLTLNAGASTFNIVNGIASGVTAVNLGAITHNAGGTVNFVQPTVNTTIGSTNGYITSTTNDAGGILGGYATVAGTNWATNNGANIVALASYTSDTWAAGTNTNVTTSSAIASDSTTHSLRFNAAAANTLTLAGTNTITSGGILVTSSVGNNLTTITGGSLQGAAGKDLVVIQNNTSNGLTIASTIVDNTSATALTKSGSGLLTLSTPAAYTGGTYMNGGVLAFAGNTLISGTTTNSSTTLTVNTTGLSAGQTVTGLNIPAGTKIASITDGTHLVLSQATSSSGGATGNVTFYTGGTTNQLSTTGDIVVTGGTFELGSTSASQTTSGAVILAGGLINNGTITKSGGSYDVRNGTISSMLAGTAGLIKTTSGTVSLYNTVANTFSGDTVITEGALTGGNAANVVAIAGNLIVGSPNGGNPASYANNNNNNAFTTANNKTVTVYSNGSVNFGGGAQNINGGIYIIGGSVTGGQLYSYSNITMTGGSFGGSTYGGSFTFNINANPTPATISASLNQSYTFNVADGAAAVDLYLTGGLASAGKTLTKTGDGLMVASGTNGFTGATTVNGGTLLLDANAGGSFNATSPLVLGGGTFKLGGKSGAVTAQTLGAFTLNNSGYSSTLAVDGGTSTSTTLNLGAITASTAGTAMNISTVNGATVTTTQANTVNLLNARITLNGSDFALGNGASAISAASTTALATTAGTDTNNSLATDNVTLASGSHTTNSLKITTTTTGQSLAIGSGNTLILTSGGLLATGAQDYSITGGTLKSNTATNSDLIVHQYGNGTLTIGSVIANGNGASTLTKAGTGVLTLTGTNTYTGSTYITAGTLSVSANNQLGAITSGQTVNLSNASTLQATNTFTMDNSGSNKRAVALGSGGGVLDVTGANTLTISGVVSGAGNLTKINTGTLSFTGTNTYTGATNITGGTLAINGTGSINGTSGITINGGTLQYSSSTALTKPISFTGTGGTLVLDGSSSYAGAMTITSGNTLGGHGTYSNTVTINSGATLSPGNSPGQITVGTLLLNSGSTSHMEIGGTTIGTQYDNVTITSNSGLTYGGLLEVVSFGGYNLDQAGTYNLFTLNSGTPSGDFSSVTVGGTSLANSGGVWTGVNGSSTYQFAESSGILTVTIPEPATVSLMFGVASMGLLARRRRQKH